MIALKVVDASAIAAILFQELKAEEVLDRLDDARLVAPTLLSFELANICVVKCRRAPDEREKLLEAMALRVGFDIEELPVDPIAVLTLALQTKLTAYDASYLWLARQFDAELVTLDQALARAAGVAAT